MKKSTSKLLVTALSAVLGLALMGGAAAAAFVPAETTVTAEKGPNTAKLAQILNALVTAGTITANQRDAILAKLAEAANKDKEEDTEEDEDEQKKDNEKSKRDLDPKLRFDIHRLVKNTTKTALEYLGLDRKVVMERMRAGESLGEIAAGTTNKTRAGLIDAIEAPATAKVEALVASGKLTATQAATLAERITAAAEKAVDHKLKVKPRAAQAPKTDKVKAPKSAAKKP